MLVTKERVEILETYRKEQQEKEANDFSVATNKRRNELLEQERLSDIELAKQRKENTIAIIVFGVILFGLIFYFNR